MISLNFYWGSGMNRRALLISGITAQVVFFQLIILQVLFPDSHLVSPFQFYSGFAAAAVFLYGIPAVFGVFTGITAGMLVLLPGFDLQTPAVVLISALHLGITTAFSAWVFSNMMHKNDDKQQCLERCSDLPVLIGASAAAAFLLMTAGTGLEAAYNTDPVLFSIVELVHVFLSYFGAIIIIAPWLIALKGRRIYSIHTFSLPYAAASLLVIGIGVLFYFINEPWLIYLLIGFLLLVSPVFPPRRLGFLFFTGSLAVYYGVVQRGTDILHRGTVQRGLIPLAIILTVTAIICYGFSLAGITVRRNTDRKRLSNRYYAVFLITFLGLAGAVSSFEIMSSSEISSLNIQEYDSMRRQSILAGKVFEMRYRLLGQYAASLALLTGSAENRELADENANRLAASLGNTYRDLIVLCRWNGDRLDFSGNPYLESLQDPAVSMIRQHESRIRSLRPGELYIATHKGGVVRFEARDIVGLFRGSENGEGVGIVFSPVMVFNFIGGLLERNFRSVEFVLADNTLNQNTPRLSDDVFTGSYYTRNINLPGATLICRISRYPNLQDPVLSYFPELVLSFGLIIVLIFFSSLLLSISRAEDVEKEVLLRTGELRHSRQMLSLVMDNIPMSVFWQDKNGTYLGCNSRFAAEAGCSSPDDIVGKTNTDLPAALESLGGHSDPDGIFRSGTARLNILEPMADENGLLRYLRFSKIPIPDSNGKTTAVLGLFEDVTSERERSIRLENSERKYRALFQNSNDAILIHDAVGDILEVNSSSAELLEYGKAELESMNIMDLYRNPASHEELVAILRQGSQVRREETLISAGLKAITAEISASLLDPRAGIVQLILRDISHQKQTQQRLTEAKKTAEEANQAKSLFIANMSHEIRTPMNAILGFADVLQREITEPELKSHISIIRRSGKTLLGIINDILDLSKIEAGRLDLMPSPLNIRDLGREIIELFSVDCERKGLSVEYHVDDSVPHALVLDGVRLRQIFLNLLGNAVKFTETGTLSLKITATGEQADTVGLSIEIADTGSGIPRAQQEEVFEAFSQVRDSSGGHSGGTGLGLTISRRLARVMGGDIRLESEEGRGSRFILTLSDIPVSSITEFPDEHDYHRTLVFEPATVIVADNNEINLQLMRKYLGDARNLHVVTTEPENLIEAAEREVPDLLFIFVGITSPEAYSKIAEFKRLYEAVPIIGITASSIGNVHERSRAAGVEDLLLKPISLRQIQDILVKYLTIVPEAHSTEKAALNDSGVSGEVSVPEEVAGMLLNEWQELENSYYTEDLELFAEKVKDVALEYNAARLQTWSEQLRSAAETVDVEAIEIVMRHLPELLGISKYPSED